MTLSYTGSGYRQRSLVSAPDPVRIADPALRKAVTRWHELRAQATEARQAVEAAEKAVPLSERADAAALAQSIRRGDAKLPVETQHQARLAVEVARRRAVACADATELCAREILTEAERVSRSPEADKLRAADEKLAEMEAKAEQTLASIRAERRRAALYLEWLSAPGRVRP